MKRLVLILLLLGLTASPAWAFPDTAVLDAFTGVDGTTPPNSNWTNAVFVGATSTTIVLQDNAIAPGVNSVDGDAYWNPGTFGPDCEVYATIVDVANATFGQLYLRLVNIGANTTDGYMLEWADGTSIIIIRRIDNGVATTLGANISQAITTTDKIGLKAVGDQICLWFSDSGGAWTELACRTDATYSAGGNIGIGINTNPSITIGAMDDFGGGTVVASSSSRSLMLLGVGQ